MRYFVGCVTVLSMLLSGCAGSSDKVEGGSATTPAAPEDQGVNSALTGVELTAAKVMDVTHTPKPPENPKPGDEPTEEPCPEGMVFVDVEHCTEVKDTCLAYGEHNRSNHPSICAKYSEDRPCIGEKKRYRFCMDKYEYPNRKGAHPPVMVDAWDATVTCHNEGKRLCWESEWTAACEGNRQQPYPYGGYERDPSKCRVDQAWVKPTPSSMISKNPKEQDHEMRRLDQGLPSGEMEGCKSEAGIYDLTGNFDEWVYVERPRGKAKFAGHKGGHWLQVRNACRPTGVGHPDGFVFYSLTFRCCKDADHNALKPLPAEASKPWFAPKVKVKKHRDILNRYAWSPEFEKFKPYAEANKARLKPVLAERQKRRDAQKKKAEDRKRLLEEQEKRRQERLNK